MSLEGHTSIKKAVSETTERFGSVDVLLNNAVFWGNPEHRSTDFEEMPPFGSVN